MTQEAGGLEELFAAILALVVLLLHVHLADVTVEPEVHAYKSLQNTKEGHLSSQKVKRVNKNTRFYSTKQMTYSMPENQMELCS